jgi:bifunctional DNA-binding transcriptional regulator/antitoxin component of YhaV-PrlF toxin-antitoxin module
MKKIIEPTGDLCVKFTEEELSKLGLKHGDKLSFKEAGNGIVLNKYESIDVDISEWSREVLEMLISESVEQDVSVNDVICSILEKQFRKEDNE